MGLSWTYSLLYLLAFPILVAQWMGVVVLGHSVRNGAWWCMLVGVIIGTLATVGTPVTSFVMARSVSVTSISDTWFWLQLVLGAFSSSGSLLFMIGFAMHALGVRRLHERTRELEMIIEAQNERLGEDG